MSAAHTPDRLFVVDSRVNAEVCRMKDGREFVVARISSRETLAISQEERDDARRLAACWNAFDGLDTETVESMVNVPAFFFKHCSLMAQRDALLSALKTLLDCAAYGDVRQDADAWIDARAAIAKVES